MTSDITLAVGDGSRRMTYAELAAIRGISALSAERLVRRKRWPRQIGNDGRTVVLVPLAETRKALPKPRPKPPGADTAVVREPDNTTITLTTESVTPSTSPSAPDSLRLLEQALTVLRQQLERAEARATEASARADSAEARAEALRAELDALRARRWWRRLVGR